MRWHSTTAMRRRGPEPDLPGLRLKRGRFEGLVTVGIEEQVHDLAACERSLLAARPIGNEAMARPSIEPAILVAPSPG
jgi:hypothetical protein